MHTPSQEESNYESKVNELAITMAKLAKCKADFFEETSVNVQINPIPLEYLEEKMTPRATSYTQLEIETQQPPQDEGMSRQELVAKHMNEEKNMVEMSFEGQHESLPSLLEVIREEDMMSAQKHSLQT